jgi:hypothetical protein
VFFIEIVHKVLMITSFVAVMMLLIEYVNVQTKGILLRMLSTSRFRQYVLAAVLGAIPGCLGAFAVVALYAHKRVSLGALVTTMIATSGDEAFVMFALFPGTAALLTLGLAVVGVVAGLITDRLFSGAQLLGEAEQCMFITHEAHTCEKCLDFQLIASEWRPPSPYRAVLTVSLALLSLAFATGQLGPEDWGWKRVTLLGVMLFGLFVTVTVPEHFLEAHLWRHVIMKHVPRIFLWTFGVLLLLAGLNQIVDLKAIASDKPLILLGAALLLGILPESGPHLIFVTLYADQLLPLSVLVASSIAQDGHGMLPLLSSSKKAFVIVKLINIVVAAVIGWGMHLCNM